MVRLILAGGIFDEADEDEAWHGQETSELVAAAEKQLALAAGEDYELLAASARADQRRALSRFLARLLLIRPRGELLQQTIERWVEAQREMLARLRSDWTSFAAWGGDGAVAGKAMHVEGELSDRHDGGRSAAILTFESGWKVVYKPRSMEADGWYSELLEWVKASGAPVSFLNPRVAARAGYGWMEFVPHRLCESREELAAYYRNAGGLLCLTHVLRATDCHFQNIIASGVHPALIDAETLFQPALRASDSWMVTQTGLIPGFQSNAAGRYYDASGLGFTSPRATHFEVPEWSESGVQFRAARLAPGKNVPSAEEEKQPYLFLSEIEDGFRQMYGFAQRRLDDLIAQIESARELRVRYLLRGTVEYYAALNCEADAQLRLGPLQPSHAVFSELLPEELTALGRLDIPRFGTAADSRDLQRVRGCFAVSGYERALHGLRELSEQDLKRQMGQMRLGWSFSRWASASI